MKLPLDFKKINVFKHFVGKTSLIFWVFLMLVMLAVAWIIFKEIGKITQLQTDDAVADSKILRVNLEKHRELEDKLNDNASFVPQEVSGTEAFTPVPTLLD